MKCLILAGGSGDRLWPLSRKGYPKQYMEINESRSLLQETIVRNLPFCEEFLITASESCRYILGNQLKAFQGLRCRVYLEQEGRKTAAAIALVCMLQNPTELIYVVSADTVVGNEGYAEAVLRAKELAAQGALVAFGIPVTEANTTYGYIRHDGEQVLSFTEKPDAQTAEGYMASGDYVWNSGSFLFRADVFLQELARCCPEVFDACSRIAQQIAHAPEETVVLKKEWLETVPKHSVERAVFEHSARVRVVSAGFAWKDIGTLEDLENVPIHTQSCDVLQHACENVTVINQGKRHLVVANELSDLMIVNTEDATYIGKKGASESLKEIVREPDGQTQGFFEGNRVAYRSYGNYEVLSSAQGYRVKRVTVFPGETISMHRHNHRSEHWSIVEGSAQISLWPQGEMREAVSRRYEKNESVFVPVGMPHEVHNPTERSLVIIEVAVGQIVEETDIVRYQMHKKPLVFEEKEQFVKLSPAFKDYLWGGVYLKTHYGKQSDLARIAESWELSAHGAGQSVVSSGRHCGMRFDLYLARIGKAAWGWKCESLAQFPILIKLLDAKIDLSIQVHPDDEYAMAHEHEYGKNELWYVLEASADAAIYHGFKRTVTKEEVRAATQDGTLTKLLRKVPVKAGDAVFIPAGTVHAIKGGVVLCEVQQNSNSTYRLYDYDRTDSYGKKRTLHIEKALDVLRLEGEPLPVEAVSDGGENAALLQNCADGWQQEDGFCKKVIGSCKYFESICLHTETRSYIEMDESSFLSVLVIDGGGMIRVGDTCMQFAKGDSFFVPAGRKQVCLEGKSSCIFTHV